MIYTVTVKPAPWELECTQDRPCAKASEGACRACGFYGPVDRRRRQLLHCPGLRPRPDGTVGLVLKGKH